MLRRDLQLSADMVHAEFPEEILLFICEHIIETDSGTDKDLLDLRKRPEFPEECDIIRVIRDQVLAWLREQTLFSRTCSVFQLFFAGREAEVRRRTADIMDIAFEIRLVCQIFGLLDNRLMAPNLDDPALVEGQRTEAAAAETAAVADEAEFHLRERRDPARRVVGRMPFSHIRERVDIIHILDGERFCRWVLDHI